MDRILVVEDNTEVRENICEILELAGYEVWSAKNGKEGVVAAQSVNPDLILCDVMMPELDGFGVLKILNKDPNLNTIPLIFLTAKAEKQDLRKGMGLGADDYITKPFDDTELLESIEMRIAKSKKLRALVENSDQAVSEFMSSARAEKLISSLTSDTEIRKYSKKDIIFEEGAIARWLYFIVSGQVKMYKTNEYGKELTTQLLNPGEFFGYYSLIQDSQYTSSAACTESSEIRMIPKDDFKDLLYKNRDFSAKFIKMIANRAENTERDLITMAYSSVRKKVANTLKAFATDADSSIKIKVSREELASKAGTAKETLIRTLSDFKSEGIIEIDSSGITIHNLKDLDNLIG